MSHLIKNKYLPRVFPLQVYALEWAEVIQLYLVVLMIDTTYDSTHDLVSKVVIFVPYDVIFEFDTEMNKFATIGQHKMWVWRLFNHM